MTSWTHSSTRRTTILGTGWCTATPVRTPDSCRERQHRHCAAPMLPRAYTACTRSNAAGPRSNVIAPAQAGHRRRQPTQGRHTLLPDGPAAVAAAAAEGIKQPKQRRRPSSQPQPAKHAAASPHKRGLRHQPSQGKGLEAPCELSAAQVLGFERKGFCVTKGLLQQQEVVQLKGAVARLVQERKLEALRQRVRVLCPSVKLATISSEAQALQALARHGTDEVGFLQFFNLHRLDAQVRAVATSKRLASAAAQLLGVKRMRLYQDCVFLKQPSFSGTNWHSDLRMAPFDTNAMLTAWIPLRPIQGGDSDSGLLFAEGSHRDMALSFWHDMQGRALDDRGYRLSHTGPMVLGDVSWHHGWTLHCAGPQPPGTQPRMALAVSYFADGARLLAKKSDKSVHAHMLHSEDAESYSDWLAELKDGAVAAHALLPVVWP